MDLWFLENLPLSYTFETGEPSNSEVSEKVESHKSAKQVSFKPSAIQNSKPRRGSFSPSQMSRVGDFEPINSRIDRESRVSGELQGSNNQDFTHTTVQRCLYKRVNTGRRGSIQVGERGSLQKIQFPTAGVQRRKRI